MQNQLINSLDDFDLFAAAHTTSLSITWEEMLIGRKGIFSMRANEGLKTLLKNLKPAELARIFVLTAREPEWLDFEAVADKILEPGPRPSVLFQTKQLWGLEDSQLTIFRLPGYVDRKNYDQLDNYIFQRCKNWRMYDQTGMEIAHRQQATLPDEGISTLGN
jgi:hypothetical protein